MTFQPPLAASSSTRDAALSRSAAAALIRRMNESIRATRIGGTSAFIGVLAGPAAADTRLPLMVIQQQRLQGVTVGSVEDLQAMCDAISLAEMEPVMDRTFPFDQAREAFAHMASGAHFGKVANRD
jgi:D-arabinose 1-dehydrogenase-like Zn-dependent alcohol dehydrogenase